MAFRTLLLLLSLCLSTPVLAQTLVADASSRPGAGASAQPRVNDGPQSLDALAIEAGAITFDGRLDDAAWLGAEVATDFVQFSPNPGAVAGERTEARVLYDRAAIYVGMRMYDSQPETIDARLARRDEGMNTDWALVGFDSYNDDRTAFVFSVNPAGVLRDFLVFDDVREDGSWDAVWDAKVHRDEHGWTAEFRIPFSQLRYSADAGVQEWGIQFARDIARTGETDFWSPMEPDTDGMVSQFGVLGQLRDLRAPRSLEIQPYVAGAITRAPGNEANPFYNATDAEPRVGLDVKYGLTSDVTLTATINPDFGQVEADPAQVNLGGFELFFQERRPFFVEGADVFSMEPRRFFSNNRPNLLYTRRIGRSPQRRGFVTDAAEEAAGEEGVVYTDAPGQTTILGAAKVSGRIGDVPFGVLNAVTGPEHGRFQAFDEHGGMVHDGRGLVEPTSNYFVGRARTNLGGTRVGTLLTSVYRDTGDDAIASLLPQQSTVGGVDVEHPFAEDWLLSAQLSGSYVTGDEEAITRLQTAFPRVYQRPDAGAFGLDESRTALYGASGEVNVLKTSGEHWLGGVHAQFVSPGFDANDLGFQSRADNAGIGGVLVYTQNEPQGAFRRYSANVFGGVNWNYDGDRLGTFVGFNGNGQFLNFWGANVNGNVWARTLDDRLTRGGPLAGSPAGFQLNGNIWSDDRKAVSGYAWSGGNWNELGSWRWSAEAGVEARPSSNLTLRVGPEFGVSHTAQQYVGTFEAPGLAATFGERYVFGEVDQTSVSASVRADWTFTPDLSLQLYVRPFIASGTYDRYRQLQEPRQLTFPVFGEDFGSVEVDADGEVTLDPGDGSEPVSFGSPNFTVRSLQGNAVLRWQYRPGSALFLVWQQQRNGFDDRGDLRFGRDLPGVLYRDDLTNVFLVKLSYWLG
ncbi:MAG TPA: hypothetical protein EYQ24_17020 [Bacteroidetes bacterium]|nr:hypothetical protein [Bacteroidota bacterium]